MSSNLAPFIDHTVLKPDSTADDVRKVCSEAVEYGFASVCILPMYVALAFELLEGTEVVVCTVVGFPLGANHTAVKVSETQLAIQQGALEIDMVANVSALKSGDTALVLKDIESVIQAAHGMGAIVKVIIETCLLSDDEKRLMGQIVTDAKADFIKTSTGFSTGGATLEDVQLLNSSTGPDVRVKASGGVRDRETALKMIEAGASRIGTSSGVIIVAGQ